MSSFGLLFDVAAVIFETSRILEESWRHFSIKTAMDKFVGRVFMSDTMAQRLSGLESRPAY